MTSTQYDLKYSADYEANSLKLVELTPELLKDLTITNSPLYIKGPADEDAVLCTKTRTYTIRQVNLSNSLILASHSQQDTASSVYNIKDTQFSTIELLPCLPRLDKIDTLLRPTMYAGPENESKVLAKGELYTYNDLLSIIQASEKELEEDLKARKAVVIDGYCRLIHPAYLHHIVDAVITTAQMHDMELSGISAADCIQLLIDEFELAELREDVLIKCLEFVSDERENEHDRFALNEHRLCRLLGERLLVMEQGKQWHMNEFMEVWQRRTPHPFEAKLEYLRGLYIKTQKTKAIDAQALISYFPLSELPTDPAGRFAQLFQEQKQWTPEDLLPFIEDLAPDKKKLDSLLLKYTRNQKLDGKTVYGSRIK